VLAKLRALAFFLWSFSLSLPLFVTMLVMAPLVMALDKTRCARSGAVARWRAASAGHRRRPGRLPPPPGAGSRRQPAGAWGGAGAGACRGRWQPRAGGAPRRPAPDASLAAATAAPAAPRRRRSAQHFVNNVWAKVSTGPFYPIEVSRGWGWGPVLGMASWRRRPSNPIGAAPAGQQGTGRRNARQQAAQGSAAAALAGCRPGRSRGKLSARPCPCPPRAHPPTHHLLAQIEGAQHLPRDNEAAVFVANHQSFMVGWEGWAGLEGAGRQGCAGGLQGAAAGCWSCRAPRSSLQQRCAPRCSSTPTPHTIILTTTTTTTTTTPTTTTPTTTPPAGHLLALPPGQVLQVHQQDLQLPHTHRRLVHVPHG
jgi:hypothetical protein